MPPQVAQAPDAAPVAGQAAARTAPSAREMLDAARAFRRELVNQQERVQDERDEVLQSLSEGPATTAERNGLEARLKDLDARNSALDQEIAAADLRVANAAAIPGATVEPPRPPQTGVPEEAWMLGGFFIVCVMMPISIAWARRLWKRPVAVPRELPAELTERLSRLEQAVDAVAVELERVGEGQRYVTRAFAEQQRALGAGAAEPIEARQREPVRHERQ